MWGKVTVGGVELREELQVSEDPGGLQVSGQESSPPKSATVVGAAHHNLLGLDGRIVPVVFTDKVGLTGFYQVSSVRSDFMRWANGAVQTTTWQLTLTRVGSAEDVEIESRVPLIARSDELAGTQTATFWHAPPGGTTSYLTGSVVPAAGVDRASADGTVRVHLGLPIDSPRWTVRAADYLTGAARILLSGILRTGTRTPPAADTWELSNALVRITPSASGGLTVEAWRAAAWRSPKTYQLTVNGTAVTTTPELTILRNDPEEAAVRLTYPGTPGRLTVDLSLRRGGRFVTGVVKRHSAANLGVTRTAAETAAAVTGGLRATAADSDGNRFVMGSSRTLTTTTATASITKSATSTFDFYVGHEVGTTPASGDAAADLFAQYLGATGERIRVVRR